eukprot:TRINITY_DN23861_c0_g1_i4.p2 TRINITY_DN23861_c0_g1~~TRINITY_DN23861_c0_g1_i4.p2  ORF type:complete len:232 (-),score=41.00 TRINITY_DN23861_c0_g1_i4:524-1219(-)
MFAAHQCQAASRRLGYQMRLLRKPLKRHREVLQREFEELLSGKEDSRPDSDPGAHVRTEAFAMAIRELRRAQSAVDDCGKVLTSAALTAEEPSAAMEVFEELKPDYVDDVESESRCFLPLLRYPEHPEQVKQEDTALGELGETKKKEASAKGAIVRHRSKGPQQMGAVASSKADGDRGEHGEDDDVQPVTQPAKVITNSPGSGSRTITARTLKLNVSDASTCSLLHRRVAG